MTPLAYLRESAPPATTTAVIGGHTVPVPVWWKRENRLPVSDPDTTRHSLAAGFEAVTMLLMMRAR